MATTESLKSFWVRISGDNQSGYMLSLKPTYYQDQPKTIEPMVFTCHRHFPSISDGIDLARKLFGPELEGRRDENGDWSAQVEFRCRPV
jgi:hypothetical protein